MAYKLLTSNNKLAKGGQLIDILGLAFAPADHSGYEVCVWRGACAKACSLWFSGRTVTQSVRGAAIRRTRYFFENRADFMADLHEDLAKRQAYAVANPDIIVCVRLNTASDIPWECIDPTLFSRYPDIRFYDYTKSVIRAMSLKLPDNYELTYSVNEESDLVEVDTLLTMRRNCAVAFDTIYRPGHHDIRPLPAAWNGRQVIDGDVYDARLASLDGQGVIVGLRGKGGKRRVIEAVEDGFVKATADGVCDEAGRSDLIPLTVTK